MFRDVAMSGLSLFFSDYEYGMGEWVMGIIYGLL